MRRAGVQSVLAWLEALLFPPGEAVRGAPTLVPALVLLRGKDRGFAQVRIECLECPGFICPELSGPW